MKVNIRVIILSSFVLLLLSLMIIRSCTRPPKKGALIYKEKCASCHGMNGEGFRNLIPPLTDSLFLMQNADEFACYVAYGLKKPILVNGVEFEQPMQGIIELNPVEIANVANYVYEKWGDPNKKFTPQEIENRLANCE